MLNLNILLIVSSLHFIQVEIRSVGKIYKIRLGHDGTSEQPEWSLQRVMVFILCLIFTRL